MLNNIQLTDEKVKLPEEKTQIECDFGNSYETAKTKVHPVKEIIQPKENELADSFKTSIAVPEIIPVTNNKPSYNFTGRTVLVVDDVSFNLTLMELFFKNTGAQMLFAENGKEAVETCISNPQVDIVLMDIQMPVMNGLVATVEIHKLKPEMPVIAITAFVHPDDKQRCFEAGCVDFLSKPCSRDNLLKTIKSYF